MYELSEPTLDPVESERQLMAEAEDQVWRKKRVSIWPLPSLLAVFVCVASVVVYIVVWASGVQSAGGPDEYVRGISFAATLTGAQIIHDDNGSSLYDPDLQASVQRQLRGPGEADEKTVWYNKPPFEALLLAPFVILPSWVVFALWTLAAGGFCIGMAVGMLDNAMPVSRRVGWVLSLAACSYFPMVRSLMLGEDTTLVLMGLCGVYLALKWEREVWAAVALVAVAFKPQMLPAILVLLLLQGRFLTIGVFSAIMGGLYLLAIPVLGMAWPLDYFKFLAGPEGWGVGVANADFMQNWRGFANVLFGETMPLLVGPVFLVLCVSSFAGLIWAWRRSRFWISEGTLIQNPKPKIQNDLMWALAGVVTVLVAVYMNPQDLTLLVFPAWIIGACVARMEWGKALVWLWLVILWMGYALAPFTLYSKNAALAVLPTVLLMALGMGLLVWMLASSEPVEEDDGRYK